MELMILTRARATSAMTITINAESPIAVFSSLRFFLVDRSVRQDVLRKAAVAR
jgi:hypothetical protein